MTLADLDLSVAGQAVSLRSLVIEKLRLAIITGRFPPGSQLKERELCELTGVSRPSLREALRLLEAEGLVTSFPNRGQSVTELTTDQVEQIYVMRRVLETFAAGEFARRRAPADIAALKKAIDLLNSFDNNADPLQVLRCGSELHHAIAKGGGNEYVTDTLRVLYNRIALIRYIALQHAPRNEQAFEELRGISAAIIDGDAALAEKRCADHLDQIGEAAKAIVAAGYRLPE